jgi:ankyrin repeat protein
MVETLAAAGADANAATTSGTTALMFASQAGNAQAVKSLIAHGANVNAKEKVKGETAISFAAAFGRADVIRVLAANGADAKVTTNVMDLAAFNKEEQERLAMLFQQQAAQNGAAAAPSHKAVVAGSTLTPSRD